MDRRDIKLYKSAMSKFCMKQATKISANEAGVGGYSSKEVWERKYR
jgi:hypothetical protein